MEKFPYQSKPVLKTAEYESNGKNGAFITFAECLEIPGLENADIMLCFDRDNSFESVDQLRKTMKEMGFRFVVAK